MKDEFDIRAYEKLLKIDKNALDDAIIQQSEIYYHICRDYAQAVSIRDEAKEDLSSVDAELSLAIRKIAEDKGTKVTESSIASSIQIHSNHEEAVYKLLEAGRNVDLLFAMKNAFSQRSYMLRELVALFISGYYMDSSRGETTTKPERRRQIDQKRIRERVHADRVKE